MSEDTPKFELKSKRMITIYLSDYTVYNPFPHLLLDRVIADIFHSLPFTFQPTAARSQSLRLVAALVVSEGPCMNAWGNGSERETGTCPYF